MSALATIVGSLGELSESELRQLYLMVGVRLGIPDVPAGARPRGTGGGKASNASSGRGGRKSSSRGPASSKGNPQRKSQWANHPLYIEYMRLKKVVETQAKEGKTSFNGVDTAESRAYKQAFTQWVEAKHSFRGHGDDDQKRSKSAREENDSGTESEEEEGEEDEGKQKPSPEDAVGKRHPRPQAPTLPPGSKIQESRPASGAGVKDSGAAGKASSSPPGKGKAGAK
jgi:hypothetical protein